MRALHLSKNRSEGLTEMDYAHKMRQIIRSGKHYCTQLRELDERELIVLEQWTPILLVMARSLPSRHVTQTS